MFILTPNLARPIRWQFSNLCPVDIADPYILPYPNVNRNTDILTSYALAIGQVVLAFLGPVSGHQKFPQPDARWRYQAQPQAAAR